MGIAETHLKGSETLSLPGYVWYGQSRQLLLVKAKRAWQHWVFCERENPARLRCNGNRQFL